MTTTFLIQPLYRLNIYIYLSQQFNITIIKMLVYCKCCGKYYEIKYPVGKKPVKSKWPQSIKLHRTIFSSQKIYASPFKIYFILHASFKKKISMEKILCSLYMYVQKFSKVNEIRNNIILCTAHKNNIW